MLRVPEGGITMHKSTDCSLIHSGDYDLIDVEQNATFADAVRFRTTMVEGSLQAPNIQGENLIINKGVVRCSGKIRVKRIAGCGTLEVKGDIVCDSIQLTGSLVSDGNIYCSGNMEMTGTLSNAHRITADEMQLSGVLHGNDIDGRSFTVRPLHSTMFSRFGMPDYQARSHADAISVSNVDASRLTCRTMTVDTATLRNGTSVESAACSTLLGIDRTSSVLLLTGACRRTHLRAVS